jgi:hypothetical protein
MQLRCIQPAARGEGGLLQTLDSLFAERDLKDAEAVKGHPYAHPVRQKVHKGWISIARSDAKRVSWARSPLDGWRQHPSGGRRGLARPSLTNQRDGDLSFSQRGGRREPDQTTTDDYYLGAQASFSLHLPS